MMGADWIAVASAEHVAIGRRGGFMQVGHGKGAPTRPLLETLSFIQGKRNWGYAFRFGLLKVSSDDMAVIMQAMRAQAPAHA